MIVMFSHLSVFRSILVTGPQRSGTTICAKMIAADTGLTFIPEEKVGISSEKKLREKLAAGGCVVQCPSLCCLAHDLADEATAVVLMRRPVEDIVRSQERIGWSHEQLELERYGLTEGVIAEVKYNHWDAGKHQAPHSFEVDYNSLSAHPLWVPADRRANFKPRQTGET